MKSAEELIWSNEKFQDLVKRRKRFMLLLFSLTLFSFFGFALLASLAPSIFGIPLWQNSATTLGIPFGLIVMTLPCLLTGIYMVKANREFDGQMQEILREAELGNDK